MARQSRGAGNRNHSNRPESGLFSSLVERLQLPARSAAFMIIIAAVMAIFLLRLVDLQVVEAADNAAKGQAARDSVTKILAHRGTIYDRNGNVLATSVEVKSVYCDPTLVSDVQEEAEDLVSVLGGTVEEYTKLMTTQGSRYVCVARKITVEDAELLIAKSLDGFYYEDELDRVYPYGTTGGQVIGCLNSDGKGYTGLELQYDEILAGTDGIMRAQAGVGGAPIPGTVYQREEPVDGRDIMVTLDIELQAEVERRLVETATRLDATGSNAVVMNGANGEIYAAASLPLFNPGDRSIVEVGATDLKCVNTAFEPGSVFKPVTALAALEQGVMGVEDELDCPAVLEADEYEVSDAHSRGDVTYSLRDIIAYSSNVGVSLVAEKMGFSSFYQKILDYKMNGNTGVDYPNESGGFLAPRENWSLIQGYNVSFGQGVMVTPLQIARFYAMVRTGGTAVTPHFLLAYPQTAEYAKYETETITTNTKALADLTSMLESVVEYGTGGEADIENYIVAGKTSTAEVASEEGGYKSDAYNLAFCGFLPNSTSELVCFVAANEVPYDTSVCPLFRDIMTYAIERYKI